MLKSSEKHTTRPTWLVEWTCTCFWGIMAQVQLNVAIMHGFQPFLVVFLLNHRPIACIVLHCCFGRYLSFLVYFCSFTFSLVRVSFHYSTIMRTLVSTSTYPYVQTTHVSLSGDSSIGHKTGTLRDQVKNTRLPPQNSSGALALGWHPDPTQTWSQPDLSHPNWTWTRCCCRHIKPFFLPNDISSTPGVLPDSS